MEIFDCREGGSEMRTIMHIDVNSAFLSWQAVYNLQKGDTLDLREIPSVVGGSQADRRGIVLAKSIPAKKFGITTGEVLWQARQKCPGLVMVPPDYNLYMKCSNIKSKDILNLYLIFSNRHTLPSPLVKIIVPPVIIFS
jgi:DNA polymerase-4